MAGMESILNQFSMCPWKEYVSAAVEWNVLLTAPRSSGFGSRTCLKEISVRKTKSHPSAMRSPFHTSPSHCGDLCLVGYRFPSEILFLTFFWTTVLLVVNFVNFSMFESVLPLFIYLSIYLSVCLFVYSTALSQWNSNSFDYHQQYAIIAGSPQSHNLLGITCPPLCTQTC